MGLGQTLITVGAIMLLSLVILRVNNNFLSTSDTLLNSKYGVLAVSLATSMIEEASGKAFDEKTDTTSVSLTSQLSTIGTDAGEVYPNYDDFDDFHNLTKIDSTLPTERFTIRCRVAYINPSNPNGTSAQKTWHKRINVFVTTKSMPGDTIKMSSIFSYWFFR